MRTIKEAPIDPAAMQFQAKPDRYCAGCLFDEQREDICQLARNQAKQRGMPSCLSGYSYIALVLA